MARISTYNQDSDVSASDKVVGTDSTTGGTKNFTLGSILSLVASTINVPGEDEVDSYVHTQGSASSTWTITHNLDKYPSIVIVDNDDDVVIGEINYQDKNTIIVYFTAAFAGKAFLN